MPTYVYTWELYVVDTDERVRSEFAFTDPKYCISNLMVGLMNTSEVAHLAQRCHGLIECFHFDIDFAEALEKDGEVIFKDDESVMDLYAYRWEIK